MPTALVINGAEPHDTPKASGNLNALLFETLKKELRPSYTLLTTEIRGGYNITAEQDKYKQSDLIIFQTPVFWFSIPSSLKNI